jgi:hypothetical protein
MAGRTEKKGAETCSGRRPIGTIGSEKRTRISAACATLPNSPVGPAETTLRAVAAPGAACCARASADIPTHRTTAISRNLVAMRLSLTAEGP